MKKFTMVGLAALLFATVTFTSCEEIPQAEIDAANAAIGDAQAAGADVYAQQSFLALQDSMKSVMEGVEAENSGFFKDFSESKAGLANVTQLAAQVKQEAETRKEELKQEAQSTITEVRSLIEANRQLASEAPKGKEGAAALQAINDEISATEAAINDAGALLDKGEILPSLDKAKSAKEKATAINEELKTVIQKYKSKK